MSVDYIGVVAEIWIWVEVLAINTLEGEVVDIVGLRKEWNDTLELILMWLDDTKWIKGKF